MSAHKTAFLLAKKAELYPKQRYYNNNFKTNYIFAVITIYILPSVSRQYMKTTYISALPKTIKVRKKQQKLHSLTIQNQLRIRIRF